MAKTKIRIPKTDIDITCHNEREASLARIFVRQFDDVVRWAVEERHNPSYWACRVVSEYGFTEPYIRDLSGQASAMYWLDMLKQPFTDGEIHNAIMAMYSEAAGNAPAPADEDDEAEQYMDGIKADAAYCLGIEYGSDEWYALAEI